MLTKLLKDLYTIYGEMVNQEEVLDTKLIAKPFRIVIINFVCINLTHQVILINLNLFSSS